MLLAEKRNLKVLFLFIVLEHNHRELLFYSNGGALGHVVGLRVTGGGGEEVIVACQEG